ncbi:MAG: hypothetical protein NT116_00745 [Candidatus Parcubacteria bacterium]|nr:hypothetical protein [Candidatus Parcubacteria bacterium]
MENLEKIKNEKERIIKLFEKGFNEFPDEFKDLEALSNEEYLAFLFSIAKLYEKKCKDEKTPAEYKKNAFPNILKKLEESAINSLSKSCVDERYLDSFNTIIGGIMFYNHYLLLFRNH